MNASLYAGSYSGASVAAAPDGSLEWRRGRRPPLALQPLGEDVFAIRDDSGVRITFKRDATGRLVAAEVGGFDGRVDVWRKD